MTARWAWILALFGILWGTLWLGACSGAKGMGDPAALDYGAVPLQGLQGWYVGSCDTAASLGHSCIQDVPKGWIMLSPGAGPKNTDPLLMGNDLWSAAARHLLLVQDHETTQAEWMREMLHNPAYDQACGDDCPVERVSFWDALTYLNRRSRREGLEPCYELSYCHGEMGAGCEGDRAFCEADHGCRDVVFKGMQCPGYRLPTELEWGWVVDAIRARSLDDDVTLDTAWCADISSGKVRAIDNPSGSLAAVDSLAGNVWEWVWTGSLPGRQPGDQIRYHRGGSFLTSPDVCLADARSPAHSHLRAYFLGLRPIRTVHLAARPLDPTVHPIPSPGAKLAGGSADGASGLAAPPSAPSSAGGF
jgi:hypothetical protein